VTPIVWRKREFRTIQRFFASRGGGTHPCDDVRSTRDGMSSRVPLFKDDRVAPAVLSMWHARRVIDVRVL